MILALPITYILSLLILTGLVIWLSFYTKYKYILIMGYAFLSLGLYFSALNILSYPKFNTKEFVYNHFVKDVTVVYFKINPPDNVIYLYLFPGDLIPRYYIEEYSDELVAKLLNAAREAKRGGGALKRRLPFYSGPTDKPMFYSNPQPRFMPPKEQFYSAPPS